MSERNYGDTGQITGGGINHWIRINGKTGEMSIQGKTVGTFAGFVDGFQIRFDEGNAEQRIAPSWKITLKLSAKDADSGEIQNYGMDVSGHLAVIAPEVINALLGTPLDWNGYFSLSIYKKNDKVRVWIKTAPNQEKYTPGIQWDPAVNRYTGCPDAPVTGVDPNTGQELKNHWPARAFWFKHALTVYGRFNSAPLTADGKFAEYLNTKLGIVLPKPDATPAPAPTQTAPQHTTLPTETQPLPNTPVNDSDPISGFKKLARRYFEESPNQQALLEWLARCLTERDKRQLTALTDEEIFDWFVPLARKLWGCAEGIGGFKIVSKNPYQVGFDDLPF